MPDSTTGYSRTEQPPPFWSDDEDWDEASLPPRPWLVPGFLMSGVITLLIGAPAVGKSLLNLVWAVSLVLGEQHGQFKPQRQCRAIVLDAEDNNDEQRRRLSAILRRFGRTPRDISGRLKRMGPTQIATLFAKDEDGALRPTEAFDQLEREIITFKPDVVFLNPLAELTSGSDENSNDDSHQVAAMLRALAASHRISILVAHHTRKGVVTPGDLDVSRGASATGGAVRAGFTLTRMSQDEATALGVPEDRRSYFIRLVDAKPSYAPLTEGSWYQRFGMELANGDSAPYLDPWQPPKDTVTPEIRAAVENGIARGIGGEPWSHTLSVKERSVKHLMTQCGVTTGEGQKKLLAELLAAGFEKAEFINLNRQRAVGLRTPDGKPVTVKWTDTEPKD